MRSAAIRGLSVMIGLWLMFFASVSSAPPAVPLASMLNSGSVAWAQDDNDQGQDDDDQGEDDDDQGEDDQY
jgi:hypothetical protein